MRADTGPKKITDENRAPVPFQVTMERRGQNRGSIPRAIDKRASQC
jgi:hypothetical protein